MIDYLEKIYEIIQEYYTEEFQEPEEISELKKKNIIDLAYTTDYNSNELQVDLNIQEKSINYYKNGKIIKQEKYDDFKQLFEALRGCLEFDLLIIGCEPEYGE